MKTVCDDVISQVIGPGYKTEFLNMLYNKGEVTQQKYHRDYKYVYTDLVKKILCKSIDEMKIRDILGQ